MVNLVNVESTIEDGKSIILLYFREGDKRIVKKVDWFKPYFYVDVPISNQPPSKITIEGKPVWRVDLQNTKAMYSIRPLYEKTYEADVEFNRRFVIDNISKIDKGKYKELTIDIETTTDYGFPRYEDPVETVTLITIHDNMSTKLVTFAINPDGGEYNIPEEVELINRDGKVIGKYEGPILLFSDEESMLKSFIKTWYYLQSDLVLGWNVVHFDLLYLFSRIKRLNISTPFNYYFRESHGKLESRKNVETVIEGSIGFDLLQGYKTIRFQELPSYSLEWVAKYELNMEHPKRRILNFTKFWKERFVEFVIYNRNDTALAVKINEVAGIVDYFEDIRVLSLLPRLDMVNTRSKAIDNILLSHFNQFVYPTRTYEIEDEGLKSEEEEESGGYVMDPERGKFEDVYVIDFSGMYPSLIRTFNLSPETVVEKGNYTIFPPNKGMEGGVSYTIDRKGILPQLVEYMQLLRDNYTKLRDESETPEEHNRWNQKRFAAKTVINALFGTMLYKGYRLHNEKVGYSITFLGRELNKYVHKELLKFGSTLQKLLKILYGDTDSSFIKTDVNIEELVKEVNDVIVPNFVRSINPDLTSYIHVEVDKHYDFIVFVAKKRYYGVRKNKKGEDMWDYVGVDIKRTNIPEAVTNNIKFVIQAFREGRDVIEEIDRRIRDIYDSKKLDDFRIPLKLEMGIDEFKVNTPVKKAVKSAEEKWGLKFRRGDKFWGVYLKEGIIAFDDVDEERESYILENLNYNKYVADFIHKSLHMVLMEDREKELLLKYNLTKKKLRLNTQEVLTINVQ